MLLFYLKSLKLYVEFNGSKWYNIVGYGAVCPKLKI